MSESRLRIICLSATERRLDSVLEIDTGAVEWRESIREVATDMIPLYDKEIGKNLADEWRSLRFEQAQISDVLLYIAGAAGLNLIVDSSVQGTIYEIRKVPDRITGHELISLIAKNNELKACNEGEIVFVSMDDGVICRMNYTGERLSLNLGLIEVKYLFAAIANFADIAIAACLSLDKKNGLRLINMRWDQAFDSILQANGLLVGRSRDILILKETDAEKCDPLIYLSE